MFNLAKTVGKIVYRSVQMSLTSRVAALRCQRPNPQTPDMVDVPQAPSVHKAYLSPAYNTDHLYMQSRLYIPLDSVVGWLTGSHLQQEIS